MFYENENTTMEIFFIISYWPWDLKNLNPGLDQCTCRIILL